MQINEIKVKQKVLLENVEVLGVEDAILNENEDRKESDWEKRQVVKIMDLTGEINVTIWNELVDTFKIGDLVKIDGFCQEFEGNKTVTLGRYGEMKKLEEKVE